MSLPVERFERVGERASACTIPPNCTLIVSVAEFTSQARTVLSYDPVTRKRSSSPVVVGGTVWWWCGGWYGVVWCGGARVVWWVYEEAVVIA